MKIYKIQYVIHHLGRLLKMAKIPQRSTKANSKTKYHLILEKLRHPHHLFKRTISSLIWVYNFRGKLQHLLSVNLKNIKTQRLKQ
jgi:hypothetical protein